MRRWLLIWFVAFSWLGLNPVQRYLSTISFNVQEPTSKFGEWILFQAQLDIQPPQNIKQAYLFIQPEEQNIILEEVQFNEDGEINYQVDVQRTRIRPFTSINYWFRIYLDNGQEIISDQYTYSYVDDRFIWQELESSLFEVKWVQGDLEFGQTILNVAQNGLQSALTYISADIEKPVRIYVYSSASDLQSAIQLTGDSWVAGHASPDLGIILVSIPPGPEARLEMERQIPHELMHIIQYNLIGETYSEIPKWLIEGLASLAELYPNTEYQRTLKNAVDREALFPISSLCSTFPSDASGAFLAYAESASFVRFLHQKFGTSGLYELIKAYQDGIGCVEGFDQALNAPLSQLEHRWQLEALGINAEWLVFENLSPYLLLLLLITLVPMIGIFIRRFIHHHEADITNG